MSDCEVTLFDKIVARTIPATIVYEDDTVNSSFHNYFMKLIYYIEIVFGIQRYQPLSSRPFNFDPQK